MIKVCPECSKVDVQQLKLEVAAEQIELGCIGNCAAYEDKSYGLIGDQIIVTETSDEFIETVKVLYKK